MTGTNIVVKDEGILRALRVIQSKSLRLRPLLLSIGEVLRASTRDRFATSTAPNGKPWAPNRKSTVVAKGSAKPNVRFGFLRDSINYTADDSLLELSSDRAYSVFMQGGTRPHIIEARRKPMLVFMDGSGKLQFRKSVKHPGTPPRPFLGISDKDRSAIYAEAREYLLISKSVT